jgi:hypothetical protein
MDAPKRPVTEAAVRKTGKKRAIRNAFIRLGMQTRAKEVVRVLEGHGVYVDEQLVRLVRVEMLKGIAGARLAEAPRPVPPPAVRRCPKGFPRRRWHG